MQATFNPKNVSITRHEGDVLFTITTKTPVKQGEALVLEVNAEVYPSITCTYQGDDQAVIVAGNHENVSLGAAEKDYAEGDYVANLMFGMIPYVEVSIKE